MFARLNDSEYVLDSANSRERIKNKGSRIVDDINLSAYYTALLVQFVSMDWISVDKLIFFKQTNSFQREIKILLDGIKRMYTW